jgi:hypothetical protein
MSRLTFLELDMRRGKKSKLSNLEPACLAKPLHALSAYQIVPQRLETIRPNPRNSRTHSKKQIRQIAASILAHGFLGLIVIDENCIILAGHGKYLAAKLLGMPSVPTLQVIGLTDVQKRTFVIADNKISENAGWDREILVKELGDLGELLAPLNWDISLTGFEAPEVDALFADLGTERPEPEDTLPPLETVAVSKAGDLWALDRHRLVCADARSQQDLDRLMTGSRARMVCADPPYNTRVADVQGRGWIKHPEFAFASGEMSEVQYVQFLEEALGNAARVSAEGAVHYVFHDWRRSVEVNTAGRTVYGAMLNLCVWAKTCAGQGSFYRSQHEFVGVFRVGGSGHQNNVCLGRFGRNRSNLWTYAGVTGFGGGRMELLALHPTVKPIALVADAIRDCTTRGDIVLDPFIGSGTTILAAEKVGRHGYGVEFEPRYVDAAIRRWQAFTKQEAVLEDDGRTFAQVQAERSSEPHP